MDELRPPSSTVTSTTAARHGRKPHQVHRRESSKWIPREPPISQRIIQPIRQRFDRDNKDIRIIEPNWKFPNVPRWKLKNYQKFCSNKITTTKYHVYNFIFKNLWEQFHRWANLYFCVIAGMNWIPALQAFSKFLGMIPVAIILSLTALKDAYEDYRRHLADKKINSQTTHVWSSETKRCRKMPWEHIIVGDYVHVSIDETIPADLLLIRSSDPQGCIFVETSNLDGESNLKQRTVMPKLRTLSTEDSFDPSLLNFRVFCNQPDKKLNLNHIKGSVEYDGHEEERITKENIVIRGCKLRNTTFVEGIVLYTGKETKAMLNNGEIQMKQSSLEKQTNIFVIYCVIILIFMCLSSGGLSIAWLIRHAAHEMIYIIPYVVLFTRSAVGDGFINMATFIISYQILIPLSLYITVELIKLWQLYFLSNDIEMYDELTDKRILCRSFTIAEELGQIQYILSDKTGTLTENKMVFKYCAINGNAYEPSLVSSPTSETNSFAHRSTDDDEPIEVNDSLRQALPRIADDYSDPQASALYYFFLNLAICNTVMVANPKHDQINNGYTDAEGFHISNSLFFLRPSDYPPSEESTPTEARSTNIHTPSSSRLTSIILNPSDIVRRLSSLNISSLFRKEAKLDLKLKKHLRIYESESPDEYCLVNAAKSYGFALHSRDMTHVHLTLPTQRTYPTRRMKIKVLKTLKFDSNRKRMSVVVEIGHQKLLLCKGADDEIMANLCQQTLDQSLEAKIVVENSKVFLKKYSRNGLRTLCMAMKHISTEEYNRWEVQHEAIENSDSPDQDEQISQSYRKLETNLKFLGLTAIEDRLQDGVEETISSLRKAGIQIWVLTGDKEDTAINIAKACQLFDSQTEICTCNTEEDLINLASFPGKYNVAFSSSIVKLLENGNENALKAIQKASAVLCYRMTPSEKEQVVKTVKKCLHGKVLAVGDGANDVPMIQAADVGIGISGQEGLQAVMASDFALARFKFLKKLLLVHGHWFYYRLSNVLLYFLYKNAMFVFVLYCAQFYSGFSANGVMDPLYMMLYPIIFTSVQPLVYGVLDQDIEAEVLLKDPTLYGKGIKGTIYKSSNFFLNIADAIWQSAVIYFIALGAYIDSTVEAWEFGFVLASSLFFCNDLHLVLITRCWTKPVIMIHVFFICVHYFFFVIYTSVTSPIFGTKSTPVGVAIHCIHDPVYWSVLLITIILALLPRFLVKVCQNAVSPGLVYKASLAERNVPPDCLPSCISGCSFL